MRRLQLCTRLTAAAITLAMTASSDAHAYSNKDAIRDSESRLRSEYSFFVDANREAMQDRRHSSHRQH